jgi:hypothetical protein|tara:strand:- start:2708 stop:2932 length:225 start_codon:yes stop_codon:yes gene_type:complete
MQKLRKLGANKTELTKDNGVIVFYSYQTPVAVFSNETGYIRTNVKYSVTTSKHINQWLDGVDCSLVDQAIIDQY